MAKTIRIEEYEAQVGALEGFIQACQESEVGEGSGIRIIFGDEFSDLGDLELALIRSEGSIYAVSNICPHKHAPKIADGIIKGGKVTCPLHAWRYDLATGQNTNTHDGIKKLDTYPTIIKDGWVYIQKPEPKVPAWRTAPL